MKGGKGGAVDDVRRRQGLSAAASHRMPNSPEQATEGSVAFVRVRQPSVEGGYRLPHSAGVPHSAAVAAPMYLRTGHGAANPPRRAPRRDPTRFAPSARGRSGLYYPPSGLSDSSRPVSTDKLRLLASETRIRPQSQYLPYEAESSASGNVSARARNAGARQRSTADDASVQQRPPRIKRDKGERYAFGTFERPIQLTTPFESKQLGDAQLRTRASKRVKYEERPSPSTILKSPMQLTSPYESKGSVGSNSAPVPTKREAQSSGYRYKIPIDSVSPYESKQFSDSRLQLLEENLPSASSSAYSYAASNGPVFARADNDGGQHYLAQNRLYDSQRKPLYTSRKRSIRQAHISPSELHLTAETNLNKKGPVSRRSPARRMQHIATDGPKPFSCPYEGCNKKYYFKSSLRRHKRIHTGKDMIPCPYCNASICDQTTLKAHMRIHTGERPFECPFCSKTFSQKGNMNRHIHVYHNQDHTGF